MGSGLCPACSVAFVGGRSVSRHPPAIPLPFLESLPPVNSSVLLEGQETRMCTRVLHLGGLCGPEGILCYVCVGWGMWLEQISVPPRPACV